MKKIVQSSQLLAVILVVIGFGWFNPINSSIKKVPKKDRMDLAWQQEFDLTHDPELGIVPRERLLKAWQYMQSLFAQQGMGKNAIPGVNWVERGPRNCGGRTRAMWVDLADPTRKTIWAGGVAGGVWKTTDITAIEPNWTPINDFFQNLAITSITQATANTQIMYFATGEGNGNLDAVRGLGVWKSTNNGATWTQLSATNNSNFHYCQKIITTQTGDTVFVATRTGLFRSINGGNTFTNILNSAIASAGGNIAQDIEIMRNGTMYVSMSGTGSGSGTVHKSFNYGNTFTTPLTMPTHTPRREIEIGVSTLDTNTVYLLCENASRITGILKSTNAGLSFDTTAAHPISPDPGIPGTGNPWKDFSRNQAWYDLSIVVDPNNSNIVFVGGIDLFRTTNGGSSWQPVSHWYGGFNQQEVHADQHGGMYEPGNSSVVYFVNDGGIYRCANANATGTPTITPKEINYNTTQFYACDIHPTAGNQFFLGGTQDNGSHRFTVHGINNTTEVTGGDGAFCHIDQNQPQFMWTSYVYTSYYRSTNGGASFSSALSTSQQVGSFISPSDYDDIDNRMYLAGNNGFFVKWMNPQTGNSLVFDTVPEFNNGRVTHVKVSPNVRNRIYVGLNNGRVVRIDSAHLAVSIRTHINVSIAGMPSTSVSCIEIENGNENNVLVTYSNYGVNSVWRSTNGGTNWTSVEGNLPDMPVRWALFNPGKPWQALLATELGVWSTDTLRGTATTWSPTNNGFANVRTDMLKIRTSDNLVIAATHGRGMYSSNAFSPPAADFYTNQRVVYINQPVSFVNTSSGATTHLWNFGDGTTSTALNPVKTYTTAGVYTISLTVNGSLNKTINQYVHVLPYRQIPYTLALGGNFETNPNDFASFAVNGTAFARGNSSTSGKNGTASGSFAWVTGLSGSYVNNTESYLYTPSFNFSANGTYNLSFKAKNVFEIGYDGYIVEYSTNHGNTWIQLGNTTATGWYDFANATTNTAFPRNTPYFNATRSSFTTMQHNVSFLAGNNRVSFRFVFKSDGGVTAAGLALDDFEITGPVNNALPVSWLNFSANRLNKSEVELYWQTATEQNNKGFWVERHFGNQQFERLGFVNGAGNTQQVQSYNFTDNFNNYNGLSYYRLAQTDLNGNIHYSKTVVVKGFVEPNQNWINVGVISSAQSVFINASETGTVQWFTLDGKLLKSAELTQTNGQIFNCNDLPTGMYVVSIISITGKKYACKVLLTN